MHRKLHGIHLVVQLHRRSYAYILLALALTHIHVLTATTHTHNSPPACNAKARQRQEFVPILFFGEFKYSFAANAK